MKLESEKFFHLSYWWGEKRWTNDKNDKIANVVLLLVCEKNERRVCFILSHAKTLRILDEMLRTQLEIGIKLIFLHTFLWNYSQIWWQCHFNCLVHCVNIKKILGSFQIERNITCMKAKIVLCQKWSKEYSVLYMCFCLEVITFGEGKY